MLLFLLYFDCATCEMVLALGSHVASFEQYLYGGHPYEIVFLFKIL